MKRMGSKEMMMAEEMCNDALLLWDELRGSEIDQLNENEEELAEAGMAAMGFATILQKVVQATVRDGFAELYGRGDMDQPKFYLSVALVGILI